jgi:hypothetical protein
MNHKGISVKLNEASVIFLLSLIAINLFQIWSRVSYSTELVGGFLFQEFSINLLMQTLEFNFLAENTNQALFYLHIYPPLMEIFRLLTSSLVFPFVKLLYNPLDDQVLFADLSLYFFYTFIYSIMNTMIFKLLLTKSGSLKISILGTLGWSLYPPNLYISSLLDSTYFTTFLIFSVIYIFLMVQKTYNKFICFVYIFLNIFGC